MTNFTLGVKLPFVLAFWLLLELVLPSLVVLLLQLAPGVESITDVVVVAKVTDDDAAFTAVTVVVRLLAIFTLKVSSLSCGTFPLSLCVRFTDVVAVAIVTDDDDTVFTAAAAFICLFDIFTLKLSTFILLSSCSIFLLSLFGRFTNEPSSSLPVSTISLERVFPFETLCSSVLFFRVCFPLVLHLTGDSLTVPSAAFSLFSF